MIRIEYIPQSKQRYPTLGDYWTDKKGNTIIKATKFKDERVSFCIAIHEMIEEYATRLKGIDEPLIMEFDLAFEEERELGLHGKDDEPGHDPRAIYHEDHVFSETIERQVVEYLGLTWEEYCKIIENE
jgi:hypothetical protein